MKTTRQVTCLFALGALGALGCKPPSATTPLPVAVAVAVDMALTTTAPSPSPKTAPRFARKPIDKLDAHTHIEPGAMQRAQGLMMPEGITHIVNLSGGSPGHGLEEQLAESKQQANFATVFLNPEFREIFRGPGGAQRLATSVKVAYDLGARGVKIHKALGLSYGSEATGFLAIDDKALDPMFDEAAKHDMPIAIHSGDPQAFWLPPTPDNERFDELRVHPGWSFFRHPLKWEQIFAQYERRVAKSSKTQFIGVHFGNAPEEPERVARMLDKYKNLVIDTAARVPEIGRVDARHDAARMRAMIIKYQDRILFGTDAGIGTDPDQLMLGSTGETPPGPADIVRFWDSTWRWFETSDKDIPTPTPIQGRWNVDGVGLPDDVLTKIYRTNAERILKLHSL